MIVFSKSLPGEKKILDGSLIAEPAGRQADSGLLRIIFGGEGEAFNDTFGYSGFVNAGVSEFRAASSFASRDENEGGITA